MKTKKQAKSSDKVINAIGVETAAEMEAMDAGALKNAIVGAEQSMETVLKELQENAEYQSVLEDKKMMESGKREVFARQKALIKFALRMLESKGA